MFQNSPIFICRSVVSHFVHIPFIPPNPNEVLRSYCFVCVHEQKERREEGEEKKKIVYMTLTKAPMRSNWLCGANFVCIFNRNDLDILRLVF